MPKGEKLQFVESFLAPWVVVGGAICHVPTWVERTKNVTVLKKIEWSYRKSEFWIYIRCSFWDMTV